MKPTDNDPVFSILLILIFAALGCVLLLCTRRHYQSRHEQAKIFLCALFIRFIFAVIIYEFGLVNVLGDEDSSGWVLGKNLVYKWTQQKVGIFELPGLIAEVYNGQHKGYFYLVGALFYITDSPARLPAAALNCFFGAMTVVFVYRIARSLFSPWVATRVGWIACFFPSMIIWSSQTIKEPIVIFLETVALYACVHLKLSGFLLRYILLCGSAILLLFPFRFYTAFLAAVAAGVALILPQITKGKSSITSAVAVAVLIIPLAVSSGILARSEAEFEKFDINSIQTFRYNISTGTGSGYKTQYDMRTTSGFLMGTAVGAAHLFLAPFPWQFGGASLRMAFTLPETLIWYWLFFMCVVPGLWKSIRTRFSEILPLLIFIAGLSLLYSLMFGNIGLIFRQRAQLLPWLLIFAGVGLEYREIKRLKKKGQDNLAGHQLTPSFPMQVEEKIGNFQLRRQGER